MRITSGGNVGIGTSSPSNILTISSGDGTFVKYGTNGYLGQYSNGAYIMGGAEFNSSGTWTARASAASSIVVNNAGSGDIIFNTNSGLTSGNTFGTTERMRITSGGWSKFTNNGTYGSISGTFHQFNSDDADDVTLQINASSTSKTGNVLESVCARASTSAYNLIAAYANNSTIQFYVRGDGVIYAQNTTVQAISDIRTKENIVNSTDGLNTILQLRPVRFDFKEGFGNNKKNQLGFIAQEVEEVFPDAVDIWAESEEEGNPYKSLGPAALIPVLVKAIQEQTQIIKDLESRIVFLESK
jgi:hypothetical protein